MNICNTETIGKIIESIETFLEYEEDQSLKKLEEFVTEEVPETGDFSLASLLATSEDFKTAFLNLAGQYEIDPEEYDLLNTDSKDLKTKSNTAPNFSSAEFLGLFHAMPLVKANFEGDSKKAILDAALTNSITKQKTYTDDSGKISKNFVDLKERLFTQIQQFLQDKNKLPGVMAPLYNKDNDIADYSHYKQVMKALDDFFFTEGNFPLIPTYSNKKGIPNLDMDTVEGILASKIYNAGALLSNFDSVVQEYFSGIININYNSFNNLRGNLEGQDKYSLSIEGLKTQYWLADTHGDEGVENSESKLIKLLVSTIPMVNKKGEDAGLYMEMKDFYLFAAIINNFEVHHGNMLKNQEGSTFKYFNENPKEGILWYVNEIMNAKNKGKNINAALWEKFQYNYELAYTLDNYFKSEELNLMEKEKNSETSLLNMFGQIINNSFGAIYSKYNASGRLTIQEMYSQNFNNIHLQSTLFSQIFKNADAKKYNSMHNLKQINKILDGVDGDTLMKDVPKSVKIALNQFLLSRTGIMLSYLSFDDLIDSIQKWTKGDTVITKNVFETSLSSFIEVLQTDANYITAKIESKELTGEISFDVEVSDYIQQTITDPFFKSLIDAHLINFVTKSVMNVTTFDDKQLPTFKLATLTQKDAELFNLQRDFERKNKKAFFKSLLIQDKAAILGTGTKLEGVHKKEGKSAVKFNVSESFTADLQFEFMGNLSTKDNPKFSVMLGNYSDKNTVLTKIFDAGFYLQSDINKVPVIAMPFEEMLNLLRQQGANYYKDAVMQIIDDYARLLGTKNTPGTDNIESNLESINKALVGLDIRTLSKKASDLGIQLTEELHYTKYLGKLSLNQLVLDNYRIFNDADNFKVFVARQEQSMLEKFKIFNKSVGDGNILKFAGKVDIAAVLGRLGLSDTNFDKDFVSEEDGKTLLPNYGKLENDKGELNPLLKKWMWINAIFRNEYMFLSGKGEYMHPTSKEIRKVLPYRGDINNLQNADATLQEAYWHDYDREMSGRLNSMAKRNVMFTATMDIPVRASRFGIDETANMTVIDDFKSTLFNIAGQTKSQDAHDGSTFIPYIYSKMIDASFPGKGYSGTKKQFGTFITEHGVTIKKDAEGVITNDRILTSGGGEIKLLYKQKQALNTIKIGELSNFKFNQSFTKEPYYFKKLGDQFRIDRLIIDNNEYKMIVSRLSENGQYRTQLKPITGSFNSLFDLWELFGAQWSTDEAGNFNEGSNELLYKIVTTPDAYNKFPLKSKMIHIISSISAVKAGAVNVNSADHWTNDTDLAYYTFQNRFMGPQLDAGHDADGSEIKEVSQVISALAQNPTTAHLAKEAYESIAEVIKKAAAPYIRFVKPGENINKGDLYKYLADKFVRTLEKSKGDNIAKVLVQSFSDDMNIPFSNQNFFVPFVRDIITRMNDEFITRYYSGTGAVLLPSHGMVQVYDVLQPDGTTVVTTHADITKRALNSFKKEHKNIFTGFHSSDEDITKFDAVRTDGFFAKAGGTPEAIFFSDRAPEEQSFLSKRKFTKQYQITMNNPKIIDFKTPTEGGTSRWAEEINRAKEEGHDGVVVKGIQDNQMENVTLYVALSPNNIYHSNEDIVNRYLENLMQPVTTTWDKIQLGDTVLAEVAVEDPDMTFPELTADSFEDYSEKTNVPKKKGKTTKKAKIAALPPVEKTYHMEILPVKLSDPDLYYRYKGNKTIESVTKITNVARDLKPSEISYTDGRGIQKNLFDFDSVKLRFKLTEILKELKKSTLLGDIGINAFKIKYALNPDFNTLINFYSYLETRDLLTDLLTNIKTTEKRLVFLLNRWTQRNLELLDSNRVMLSINDVNSFDALFNGDKLKTLFRDGQKYYSNKNTQVITNYKFEAAELILGDIYESKFGRNYEDSMSEIKSEGALYFHRILNKEFNDDSTDADIKLNLTNLDTPVYIKYTDKLPGNDYKFNIKLERPLDSSGVDRKFVRRNNRGQIVYTIPNHEYVRVREVDGKEIIYIKSAQTRTIEEGKKLIEVNEDFNKNLNELIYSFKGNIKSFIPLMNSSELIGDRVNNKEEIRSAKAFFNKTTLRAFSRHSGYVIGDDVKEVSNAWLKKNRRTILTQLSDKMYASWEKSHEFVSARIPAQSMQSFQEMKNVAYLKTKSNDAYVSIWQIWLQGSDFDIDKAYLLGSGFNSNGQFESWSPISHYSSALQLNALERLPTPNNIQAIISKDPIKGINLDSEIQDFFQMSPTEINKIVATGDIKEELSKRYYHKELSTEQINVINRALRKISQATPKKVENEKRFLEIKPIANQEKQGEFLSILNAHNLDETYLKKEHAVRNSVVARIKQIISTPSNQLLANTPVDIDDWHESVDELMKKREVVPMLLSSYDMFSMYKQQRDAAVGKDDVGIAANGMKVLFALSTYYNEYYNNGFPKKIADIRTDFKTFNKQLKFVIDGEEKNYSVATVADVDIDVDQEQTLKKALGVDFEVFRTNAAISLSGFLSAATDNAKELLMAKVNANAELASMHIYLLILGFTPAQVVEIMTQPLVERIVEQLETNIFFQKDSPLVNMIIDSELGKAIQAKDEVAITNASSLKNIFQGAQEIKFLAKILGANQKTSANIEEVNKFLTNFETIIYSREHQLFGDNLIYFKNWAQYKNSPDINKAQKVKKDYEYLVEQIFKNNSQLDEKLDRVYVEKILLKASKIKVTHVDMYGVVTPEKEVSLLGGEFDFKYYFNPKNTEYRTIAREYYNLIKNTFNIFDVVDEVPHFKEMVNGLVLAHNLLLNSTFKYNTAFTLVKDTIRENAYRVINKEDNPDVKNQMGNPSLYPMITSKIMQKSLAGVDIRLKSEWLRTDSTDHLTFNVTELMRMLNAIYLDTDKEILEDFIVYTSDEARNHNEIKNHSVKVNSSDTEDTIIDLKTNYGIANFKKMMEDIILPILQTKSNILTDSFRVQSIWNVLGVRGSAITSTFPLSSLNSAVAKDKSQKLTKAFNNLDVEGETKEMIKNSRNEPMKWRDLFYLYNLLVNNEKYGNLRLTPLFEDYTKEKESLGSDYIQFSATIDKGTLKLFDLERDLENDAEYKVAIDSNNKEELAKLRKKVKEELDNDILFYALNSGGSLVIGSKGQDKHVLQVSNGDFVVITSLTETVESKRTNAEFNEILRMIKDKGFIIQFKC